MSDQPLRIERLGPRHILASFSCGYEELDRWLRVHALASDKSDSSRVFVATRGDVVAGYYALTMGHVRIPDAPPRLVRGLPGYPVGIVLLARLAVDRGEQGRGLGAELLRDALIRAVTAGEVVAARLVVVDAIDEAAARFYARFGFIPAPGNPLRLYRRIKDIRASIEAASPP